MIPSPITVADEDEATAAARDMLDAAGSNSYQASDLQLQSAEDTVLCALEAGSFSVAAENGSPVLVLRSEDAGEWTVTLGSTHSAKTVAAALGCEPPAPEKDRRGAAGAPPPPPGGTSIPPTEPEPEPEPEPELELELEPMLEPEAEAEAEGASAEEGTPPRCFSQAQAYELVQRAVDSYHSVFTDRYGVDERTVRKLVQPEELRQGASKPVGVNWHFLVAVQTTIGDASLTTEDVAEILKKATATTELSVVETFFPGCMVHHREFVSHPWRA